MAHAAGTAELVGLAPRKRGEGLLRLIECNCTSRPRVRWCRSRVSLDLSSRPPGEVEVATSLEEGVAGSWLIVESLAEDLDLKRRVLGDLEDCAEKDALIATNSSSYPSSQMLTELMIRRVC